METKRYDPITLESFMRHITQHREPYDQYDMGYVDAVDNIEYWLDANAMDAVEWITVTERLPENFVSVLGYMTDAGDFPPVRECYTVGNAFFFPALGDIHPVSHWLPMPEPPKEV